VGKMRSRVVRTWSFDGSCRDKLLVVEISAAPVELDAKVTSLLVMTFAMRYVPGCGSTMSEGDN
jgi:hypothetical protein